MSAALRRSLASLELPNYRRWFAGMVISVSGNWMQTVAEMWLILKLTGSGTAVGLTAALQFLPMLLVGAWGGLLADRLPKRRLLVVTQTMMAVPALALFGLTLAGVVQPWMVFALVLLRGSVLAVDNPARQSFVFELVGSDRVVNAVALNSVLVHASRVVGPAAAGLVIATLGIAPCFLVNALSFAAMIVALRGMDPKALTSPRPASREPGQVKAALRHVRATPELAIPLGLMAVVGTLTLNYQVLLPLLARFTWHGSASTYALLTATMGAGAIAGALAAGTRRRVDVPLVAAASVIFGGVTLLAAAAPTLPVQLLALPLVGAASVTFSASLNSSMQLAADPRMRGRVMALYSVVFLGSTPIGGPLTGWIAQTWSPRLALVVGGAAAIVAGLGAQRAWIRASRRGATAPRGGGVPLPAPARR